MESSQFSLLISLFLYFRLINCQGPIANFPIIDCGMSGGKQCAGAPEPTCLSSGICTSLVKYSYNPISAPDQVQFELFGIPPVTGSANFWIALGFNPSARTMAGTWVNECVYNNGRVDAFTSYNSDGHINRRSDPDKLGTSFDSGSFSNGILNCSFVVDRVRHMNNAEFSLSQPMYVILGSGAADAWTLRPHVTAPMILNDHITFASANPSPNVYPNLEALRKIAPSFDGQNTQSTSSSPTGLHAGVIPAGIIGCGTTKGCLLNPPTCLSAPLTCQTILSYQQDPDNSNQYKIELWRQMAQGDQYVAVGLSNTSPGMSGSSVLGCTRFGNRKEVLKSYNPGYYNTPIENPYEGVYNAQVDFDDSHMYCQFTVNKQLNFRTSSTSTTVDLNNPVFMMLAYGPANQQGGLSKHSTLPLASSTPVNMGSLNSAKVANKDLLKAHGGLMAGVWMFLASLGIITARFYKNMWLTHQPFGLKMWFHIHRPVMLLVVAGSIAAFVIIFVHVGKWTATPITDNAHPAVGMVAFILAIIQPIMAFFRPHPGTSNRPIFNWAHFLVGFSSHALAIAAVLLGLRMHQLDLSESLRNAAFWIVVAYAAFHSLWTILLQLIDLIAPRISKPAQTTIQMKTISGSGTVHQETVLTNPTDPAERVKTAMWFVQLIVVAGLTTAVLVIIGISN